MSRVANKPINVPHEVNVNINADQVSVKGPKGSLTATVMKAVTLAKKDTQLVLKYDIKSRLANINAGTFRAILANMIVGVSVGFEKKLSLVGVAYRAKEQGKILNLMVGFSHAINHSLPEGISVETPTPTEIILKGSDKGILGQVAADIRSYRAPEPYKGKGIRYANEVIKIKETKKK